MLVFSHKYAVLTFSFVLQYITIHRVHPRTQKGYLLVVHTAFTKRPKERGWGEYFYFAVLHLTNLRWLTIVNPIELSRTRAKFICGFAIDFISYEVPRDTKTIKGLPSKLIDLPEVPATQKSDCADPLCSIIVPDFFPPGSIMIFEVEAEQADPTLDTFCADADTAAAAFSSLDLVDLNIALYRADAEERDATEGKFGVYEVPAMSRLTYCGLEGWMGPLQVVVTTNDLGHPLCENLRRGTWALDYTAERLFQ